MEAYHLLSSSTLKVTLGIPKRCLTFFNRHLCLHCGYFWSHRLGSALKASLHENAYMHLAHRWEFRELLRHWAYKGSCAMRKAGALGGPEALFIPRVKAQLPSGRFTSPQNELLPPAVSSPLPLSTNSQSAGTGTWLCACELANVTILCQRLF